ncbi:MAG: histidine--tRNA ligase [Bacilli bacterium]
MKSKKPLKGMQDVLPKEAILRRNVQNKIIDTFIKNGFFEISTPALDSLDLLASSQGGDNEKIMFNVLKRGEKLDLENAKTIKDISDMGLRFDLTLPLSRFYANNMNDLPSPFKVFQIGNVWRGERPQRGRFRQFIQCDIDIMGDATITSELSLIKTVSDALINVGFDNIEIKINNRILVNELLEKNNFTSFSDEVMIILDKLDKISFEDACGEVEAKGLSVENFKKLYNQIKELEAINLDQLPTVFDSEVVRDFVTLIKTLNNNNYNLVYDPTLIRGMGYYTGTIFEVKDNDLGLSIAGGGRYDKLVGKIIGMDVPACGFSIGFERIIVLLLQKSKHLDNEDKMAILIDTKYDNYNKILEYVEDIQNSGRIVSMIAMKKNVKKQIADLEELGYNEFKMSREFEN